MQLKSLVGVVDYEEAIRELDEIFPTGWEQHIDLTTLDINSDIHCILGQIYSSWRKAPGYIKDIQAFEKEGAIRHSTKYFPELEEYIPQGYNYTEHQANWVQIIAKLQGYF